MNKFPLVSILMNCYNGEKYLRETLNCIINQTYKNWELIFWDNKSSDNSKKIVKQFKDNRIKYFKSEKFQNLYNSRNLAIKKAKGKYVGFLDVDDLWEKTKLKKQIQYLLKHQNYKIIYSNFFLINQVKKIKNIGYKQLLPVGFITQKILNNYSVGLVTVILDKKIFRKHRFNKKYNIIGDFDFFIKVSQKYKFGCIQSPLASYRVHESNLSGKRIDLHIKELKYWLNLNKKKLKNLSLSTNSIYKTLIKLKIKYFLKYLGV